MRGGGKNNAPDTVVAATSGVEEEARPQEEEEARLQAEEEARLQAEEEARLQAEEEARLQAEEEARLQAEEEARLKAEEEAKINELHKLLEENPDIQKAYNDILSSVRTFSSQIGENGFDLIKSYVDELGDGKVDVTDVYKILFIESNGNIYDKNGNYLTSNSNALGPFQIKECVQIDMNKNFGTNYNIRKPKDNLAVHVLFLRWLNNYRTKQINNGKNLPTGNNLKDGIVWGYHAGAYAKGLSKWDKDYLAKFHRLSILDNYPELYQLMESEL